MLKCCVWDGNENVLYVFVINGEVNEYNLMMIRNMCIDLCDILVKDFERDKVSGKMILREKFFVCYKSDGMFSLFVLLVNVRVMLICNIDVLDGFVNGVIGIIMGFLEELNGEIKLIVVFFDNRKVGEKFGIKKIILLLCIFKDVRKKWKYY